MKHKKIAIIGAGFTGLTAAFRLAEAGYEVEIFEAGGEPGGLAAGFQLSGTSLEKTYHHIFRTDTDIINLVEELGLSDKLEWRQSSVDIYYDRHFYPFVTPLDLLRFAPLKPWNRVRLGLVALFLQKYKNWQSLTNKTAYTWMKKWAGKEAVKVIWEPLLKGKFHDYYDKVSMAWLWARIHIRANSKQKGELTEKLGYFNGGFQIIIDALVEKLNESGVKIHTNSPVSKVEVLANDEVRLTVKDQDYEFSKVLATIPSHVLAKISQHDEHWKDNREYLDKLNSIDYLGAIVMVFTSTQKISDTYWHNINDLSAPFLVFLNHTALIEKERYGNKYVYYIGAYLPHDHQLFKKTDIEISKLWLTYLQKLFPVFTFDRVEEEYIFKLANAQHIVDTNYQSKIPAYQTPLPNVYLANFSQIFPEDRGTNYAVREGNKAADMLISDNE